MCASVCGYSCMCDCGGQNNLGWCSSGTIHFILPPSLPPSLPLSLPLSLSSFLPPSLPSSLSSSLPLLPLFSLLSLPEIEGIYPPVFLELELITSVDAWYFLTWVLGIKPKHFTDFIPHPYEIFQ